MDTLTYPYRPRFSSFAFAVLFFGACAAGMGYVAWDNDAGLYANGLELGPQGATIFYWCVSGASMVFVIVATFSLIVGAVARHHVTLTHDTLTAPRSGVSRQVVQVALGDVRDLTLATVHNQRFLYVLHAGGKLAISESMLPEGAFARLCDALARRCPRLVAAENATPAAPAGPVWPK